MTSKELLKAVPILKFTEILAYLRHTGWTRIEVPKPHVALFQKKIGETYFEALLPLSKAFSDYTYRIIDVLESIAQAENREVHQVLTDLTNAPGDTVRFRVINKDTVGGTISFLEGVTLMEATKKALFTAACDLLQPEKYHKRLALKGAQQFIESCRFGQTEQGSFIATVICPFINQTAEDTVKKLSVFDPAADLRGSLTRSVTTRMMSALSEIKHHIDLGEEKRILDLEGEKMISANFLESIIELIATKETTEIEIMTNWSVFAGDQPQISNAITFSNDYIPVLESLIDRLKPVETGYEDDFVGKISMTKADPDIHTRSEGEIILNYITGDEEKVAKARVLLSNEDYTRACEAHQQGRSVKIRGKLVTVGRTKTIEKPLFEIVS